VDQLISSTGVLDSMGDFWTGVTATTFGLTFVSANGKIISTAEMVPGSALDSQFVFDTVAKAWKSSTGLNHTFVCQKEPGKLLILKNTTCYNHSTCLCTFCILKDMFILQHVCAISKTSFVGGFY